LDALLFEIEADVISPSDSGVHDEVIDAVGALWDQLSSSGGCRRSADAEILEEAFTRGSLDIGPTTTMSLPPIGPFAAYLALAILRNPWSDFSIARVSWGTCCRTAPRSSAAAIRDGGSLHIVTAMLKENGVTSWTNAT